MRGEGVSSAVRPQHFPSHSHCCFAQATTLRRFRRRSPDNRTGSTSCWRASCCKLNFTGTLLWFQEIWMTVASTCRWTPRWARPQAAVDDASLVTAATGVWWQTTVTRPVCLETWTPPAPAVQPASPTRAASSPEISPHRTTSAGFHPAPAAATTTTKPSAAPAAPAWPAAAPPSLHPGRKRGSRLCSAPCRGKLGGPASANTSLSWFLDSSDRLRRRRQQQTLSDLTARNTLRCVLTHFQRLS